ncbi:flagellar hook-associated protein FlgK [Chimaeribacter arupi]|jgi:flagellar hook-associated protein 1 FlgK|uniref:Flagellar hook-associated protein 1 n=2 Tax=Yersiniaceae TaxID=1903411 RepID=A0A2N5EHA8_9GAMM|nr:MULTISPECIES: flagellar hook-associated protein FlgK [Yersiniaceae]MBS0967473.1 flagellar hook-associated protein FlgK [Nissabacter archeti]MDV5141565.1 flagellar hook-associated protein FlgK [Chimaeribacter arupi]PLR29327.1 flagellar hook-associated protein FlgK [Chimaeribacter arupi]PLR42082.1 flagellar hook-associated protein FlgK [Chimaeribacter arupi]PLR42503.1 flagellar hook-associated protein FlgK [Chimaeribacter arupi]
MSNNLINTAMSGLNAAQAALSTASNNISNVTTAGYNRQTAVISQNTGTNTAQGYIGNGVVTSGVNREYNQFIVNQLRSASTTNSALTSYYNQVSQVDDLLSDSTNSLSTTMQTFFSNLQSMVSNPGDDAARQTVLGSAQGLVNQFQSTDKYLKDMESGVNQQISDNVDLVNNYAKQIATLNNQISRARGAAGSEPNALLDQRDQLVSELNDLVGVSVTQQDGDTMNISVAGGLMLVQGGNAYSLEAVPSSSDPSRLTIGYNRGNGTSEVPESQLTTGTLGGLLSFRSESLDPARNQLGQLAVTMADQFNQIHEAGFDLEGDAGGAFFSFTGPTTLGNVKNSGTADMSVTYTDTTKVQASDYTLKYNGSSWNVTRVSDGAAITATSGTDSDGNPSLSFDGLSVSITGAAAGGDSFTLKTVSNAAGNLQVAITDSSKIAAASEATSGVSDNRNAQKLLDLQTSKVVQGKTTLSGAYASLVSDIGNQTSTAKLNNTTQGNIVTQLTAQQQSISGVNLDEEYGDLQRYQQYYLANAQVIQTAGTIFNALMDLRG